MNKKLRENNPNLRPLMMQHIRQVRPEFFLHEGVARLQPLTRLVLIGLWTCADKHGRFDWRLGFLKARILPFDPVDFGKVLDELVAAGFIQKYSVGGEDYGLVLDFRAHQVINNHESKSPSSYPEPQETSHSSSRTCRNLPERAGISGKG